VTVDQQGPPKLAYYTNTSRKVVDFLLGFFAVPIIPVTLGATFINQGGIVLGIVLMVLALVVALVTKRRFLGYGIISVMLLPLLVLGACLVAFGR